MTTKIITTVGTSLFENYVKSNEGKKDKRFSPPLNDFKEKAYPFEKWNDRVVKNNLSKLEVLKTWYNENPNASAEIKSILKIKEQIESEVEVHLIATDTVLSVKAAELVKEWFDCNNSNITVHFEIPENLSNYDDSLFVIKHLRIDTKVNYNKGFSNLIMVLDKVCNQNTILNITGGYKSIIPVLTIFGQINGLPLKYIYNENELKAPPQLVTINDLPLNFDWEIVEANYIAFESLKKKGNNLPQEEAFISDLGGSQDDYDKLKNKFNLIFINESNRIELTYLGKMIFDKYEELYNKDYFKRQNLLSNLVEYKIYEFLNKKNKPLLEIGKKVSKEGYDIDLYYCENNFIHAIEVKPGGNIPTRRKNNTNNTIPYRLEEGSFRWIVENCDAEGFVFDLWLYSHRDIHPSPIRQLIELFKSQHFSKNVELRITHLKLNESYKKDFTWTVNENKVQIIHQEKFNNNKN